MSEQTPKIIIETKQKIQHIVSNLMSDQATKLTQDEINLTKIINKYKVANQEELKKLSGLFGNILELPAAENTGS